MDATLEEVLSSRKYDEIKQFETLDRDRLEILEQLDPRFDSAGIGRVVPESICKVWGKSNGGERSSSIPSVKLLWLLLMLVPVEYLETICRGTLVCRTA